MTQTAHCKSTVLVVQFHAHFTHRGCHISFWYLWQFNRHVALFFPSQILPLMSVFSHWTDVTGKVTEDNNTSILTHMSVGCVEAPLLKCDFHLILLCLELSAVSNERVRRGRACCHGNPFPGYVAYRTALSTSVERGWRMKRRESFLRPCSKFGSLESYIFLKLRNQKWINKYNKNGLLVRFLLQL